MNLNIILEAIAETIARVPAQLFNGIVVVFMPGIAAGVRGAFSTIFSTITQKRESTFNNHLKLRYEGGWATQEETREYADSLIKNGDRISGFQIKVKHGLDSFNEAFEYFSYSMVNGGNLTMSRVEDYLKKHHSVEYEEYCRKLEQEEKGGGDV